MIVVFWDMMPCTLACCIQGSVCSVLVGRAEESRLLGIPMNDGKFILRWILKGNYERTSTALFFRGWM